MSKAISDTRSLTRTILDEAITSDWTNAEVDRSINNFYHQVVSAVVNVFEDFYLTTGTFNTTDNQQEYGSSDGLATDVLKLRRVEINMTPSTSGSNMVKASPIAVDAVRTRLGNANIGTFGNPAYYRYGFEDTLKIGFLPIPSDGGTAAGKIWYIQLQSDLSDSNTDINIPYADRYYSLIAKGAAAELLRKGQQEEVVAKSYLLELEANIAKMQMELEDTLADETKQIIDVTGEPLIFDESIL